MDTTKNQINYKEGKVIVLRENGEHETYCPGILSWKKTIKHVDGTEDTKKMIPQAVPIEVQIEYQKSLIEKCLGGFKQVTNL